MQIIRHVTFPLHVNDHPRLSPTSVYLLEHFWEGGGRRGIVV
jgi:hypothetical protein